MNTISSNQAPIVEINDTKWTGTASTSQTYTDALEQGKVLYFPNLEFGLTDAERAILNPELVEEKISVLISTKIASLALLMLNMNNWFAIF